MNTKTPAADYSAAVDANIAALNVLDAARAELKTAQDFKAGFKHASRLGRLHLNARVKRATAAVKAATAAQKASEYAVMLAASILYSAKRASEIAADPFEPENCKCCDRPISSGFGLMMEMSVGQKYTTLPGVIPADHSQGWFAFHDACAFRTLARAQYSPA
jgi:hypothetical protein